MQICECDKSNVYRIESNYEYYWELSIAWES